MTPQQIAMQAKIISNLKVVQNFNVQNQVSYLVKFLSDYLFNNGLRSFVVGISGGVDSLSVGLLTKRAVQYLKEKKDYNAQLICLRLPYGEQQDAADAQDCIDVIQPDLEIIANIKSASDSLLQSLMQQGLNFKNSQQQDFIHGNIKARQRMVALFAAAAANKGIVVGTDNSAETLVGFSTKYGDNAADVMPLAHLNKRMVRHIADHLGAPGHLVNKVPTADLESLTPLQPDEDSIGVTYNEIDDFLENKVISSKACARILKLWDTSAHKRSLPITPN